MFLSQIKINVSIEQKIKKKRRNRKRIVIIAALTFSNELLYNLLIIRHESDQEIMDHLLVYFVYKICKYLCFPLVFS